MKASVATERKNYRPGEEIRGTASWTTAIAPKTVELRLFWHTAGKGTRDSATVEALVFDHAQAQDTRPFAFSAPDFPPSFSGKLISLIWGLELVLNPGGTQNAGLVISPDGHEIELQSDVVISMPVPEKPKFPWGR